MNCPYCDSNITIKYGTKRLKDGSIFKTYWCKTCNKRCTEGTGSPMARLRTPTPTVSLALKMQTEGRGIRAAGRVLEKPHATIIRWEKRLVAKESDWSPPAPVGGNITWVRPHWGLAKDTIPVMVMGLYQRPVKIEEMLCWRGLPPTTS